jgi:hypothetical protein
MFGESSSGRGNRRRVGRLACIHADPADDDKCEENKESEGYVNEGKETALYMIGVGRVYPIIEMWWRQ